MPSTDLWTDPKDLNPPPDVWTFSWASDHYGRTTDNIYAQVEPRPLVPLAGFVEPATPVADVGVPVPVQAYIVYAAQGWGADNGLFDPWESYDDANANGQREPGETFADAGRKNGQYDPGEPFDDANGNGLYDPGDPFSDTNANGQRDADEPYTDADADGQYTPPEPFTDLDALFVTIPAMIACDQPGAHCANAGGATFIGLAPGDYTLTTTVTDGGAPLGRARLIVGAVDVEITDASALMPRTPWCMSSFLSYSRSRTTGSRRRTHLTW